VEATVEAPADLPLLVTITAAEMTEEEALQGTTRGAVPLSSTSKFSEETLSKTEVRSELNERILPASCFIQCCVYSFN
jgi:hypothetical protein